MCNDPSLQTQPTRQFLSDYRVRIVAQDDVNFMLVRIEIIQQPLGIQRAARSGNGNHYFQTLVTKCLSVVLRKSRRNVGLMTTGPQDNAGLGVAKNRPQKGQWRRESM